MIVTYLCMELKELITSSFPKLCNPLTQHQDLDKSEKSNSFKYI